MSMFVVAPAGAHHHESSLNHSADQLGVGVTPLFSSGPVISHPEQANDVDDVQDLLSSRGHNSNNTSKLNVGGIHRFWQSQTPIPSPSNNALMPCNNSWGSSGTATCQDCGNQAKKDCSHRRCRTCCKSRGFDCTTHVKSTWVPAARRRDRQLTGSGGGTVSSSQGVKKPRLVGDQGTTASHTSTSNNTATPPRSFDTGSSHQDAGFKETLPGQVRAPAVLKCVRVTAVDDGEEDEYAYQAVAMIGGHVFKGFLYDQGVDQQTRDDYPNMSELHLGSRGGAGGTGGHPSSSPIIDPANVHGAGGGGMLGGSGYGNPMN